MREVLTLEDFSLAKSPKLYPTLKVQLRGDNGPTGKQKSASSLPVAAPAREENSCD